MKKILFISVSILLLAAACDKQQVSVPPVPNPQPQNLGTLSGTVSIGPICPVETNPPQPQCQPTAEMYAAREFLVLSPDQKTTITSFHANADGKYSLALPPGIYVVVSAKTGFGNMSNLPMTATIIAGQTTTLNISVDTGIR